TPWCSPPGTARRWRTSSPRPPTCATSTASLAPTARSAPASTCAGSCRRRAACSTRSASRRAGRRGSSPPPRRPRTPALLELHALEREVLLEVVCELSLRQDSVLDEERAERRALAALDGDGLGELVLRQISERHGALAELVTAGPAEVIEHL